MVALRILLSGENLPREIKYKLKEYKAHLIMVIEKIKERKIDMKIKYDLEEFKKVHVHFVNIIDQMHSGGEIDTKTILDLERKQANLINDINQQTGPNIMTGQTVGIMTRDQLEKFKKNHGGDTFIEADDKNVKIFNKKELKIFKKDNSYSSLVDSISDNQKISFSNKK